MDRCVTLAKEVVVGRPAPPVRKGGGGFADWLILAVHCLRERETETYRSVVDKLRIMPPIRNVLGLDRDELPHPSTLCKAMDRLTMALCRRLLQRTTQLQELGGVTAIDALGFNRIAASGRYARRTNYRFLAMWTTLLGVCQSSTILHLHCSASRPYDTQIGWQVLARNLARIRTVTTDKVFDLAELRDELRENGVQSINKHREFDRLDRAHNARLGDDVYHRRSVVESAFAKLNQCYGDRLTARTWNGQFRDLAIVAAVKHIDSGLETSHH